MSTPKIAISTSKRNIALTPQPAAQKDVTYPIHGPEDLKGNFVYGVDMKLLLFIYNTETKLVDIFRYNRERIRSQDGGVQPYLPSVSGLKSDCAPIIIKDMVFGADGANIWAIALYKPNPLCLEAKDKRVIAVLNEPVKQLVGGGNLIYVNTLSGRILRQLPWKMEQTSLDFEEIDLPKEQIPSRLEASGDCLYAIVEGAKTDSFFWLCNNTKEKVFWWELPLHIKVSQMISLHGNNGYIPNVAFVDNRRSNQQIHIYHHETRSFQQLIFYSETPVYYTASQKAIFAQNSDYTYKHTKEGWTRVDENWEKKGVMMFANPNGHFPIAFDEDGNVKVIQD